MKKNQMELLGTKWKKLQHLYWKFHWIRINSKLDTVEEMISKLEDIAMEYIQNETQRKVTGKMNEQTLSYLRYNIRWSNICVIGVSWTEETRKIQKNIWRNGHTYNNVYTHTHTKAYQSQISDNKKILKAAREKRHIMFRGMKDNWKPLIRNGANQKTTG